MIKSNKYVIIISVLILLVIAYKLIDYFFAFKPDDSDCKILYGKEFNNERMKRGIPVIPENWITERKNICEKDSYKFKHNNAGVQWYDENHFKIKEICKRGKHNWKVIVFNDKNIIKESDTYYGIKKGKYYNYDLYEKEGYEYITITYSYDAEREGYKPWHVEGKILNINDYPTSLWKADSLLRSWGISRVNYIYEDSLSTWKKYEKIENPMPIFNRDDGDDDSFK
jgi:hypothetical protein